MMHPYAARVILLRINATIALDRYGKDHPETIKAMKAMRKAMKDLERSEKHMANTCCNPKCKCNAPHKLSHFRGHTVMVSMN